MNRGVLRAEMIDFIASIESNVQTLMLDDKGTTRARLNDRVDRSYDYSEAIQDMRDAVAILPDIPYLYFNPAISIASAAKWLEHWKIIITPYVFIPIWAMHIITAALCSFTLKTKRRAV